jgi:hypothetical protein
VFNAIEFVFNKLKTVFEDLVAWLGVLFNWDDILRTHRVIKNELKSRAKACVNSIDLLRSSVLDFFLQLENKINL